MKVNDYVIYYDKKIRVFLLCRVAARIYSAPTFFELRTRYHDINYEVPPQRIYLRIKSEECIVVSGSFVKEWQTGVQNLSELGAFRYRPVVPLS